MHSPGSRLKVDPWGVPDPDMPHVFCSVNPVPLGTHCRLKPAGAPVMAPPQTLIVIVVSVAPAQVMTGGFRLELSPCAHAGTTGKASTHAATPKTVASIIFLCFVSHIVIFLLLRFSRYQSHTLLSPNAAGRFHFPPALN